MGGEYQNLIGNIIYLSQRCGIVFSLGVGLGVKVADLRFCLELWSAVNTPNSALISYSHSQVLSSSRKRRYLMSLLPYGCDSQPWRYLCSPPFPFGFPMEIIPLIQASRLRYSTPLLAEARQNKEHMRAIPVLLVDPFDELKFG